MAECTKGTYETREINLYGIVQGIGFRPFITRLADYYGLKGKVKNAGAHVQILISGTTQQIEAFIRLMKSEKPIGAVILEMTQKSTTYESFEDFSIEESEAGEGLVMVAPDLPLCASCYKELTLNADRRYKHPLISCMACGPRYSIINQLPYDRQHTSMGVFEMCPKCYAEYTSRKDRRYHAQTISCYECGPQLMYLSKEKVLIKDEAAYDTSVDLLKEGHILAVKGIGGYHLVASPFNHTTVMRLRQLKQREMKPFAVMFQSIQEVEKYCVVTSDEKALLESQAVPIVLLKRKTSLIQKDVYKDSRELGVFLPYTPLQHLLVEKCGPLIMTSANLSQQPIIKDDVVVQHLFPLGLEGILYHERQIRVALDDSVAKCTSYGTQMIRRSRGYAPVPLHLGDDKKGGEIEIFATGGDLKASFSLGKNQWVYPSEYLGDLEEESCFENYKERFYKLQALLQIKPQYVVCDEHPKYFTSQFAQTLGLPILKVQHHHGHIASVMAEHQLQQVIGIAFDGTGYGEDGTIWGSEFLVCDQVSFKRCGHLRPLRMIGGDETLKEVQKITYFYLRSIGCEACASYAHKELLSVALQQRINTYITSSMGRLFDGISGLLNICQYNQYEGQAAIRLENLAAEGIEAAITPLWLHFEIYKEEQKWLIDYEKIFKDILVAVEKGIDKRAIALGFHEALACITVEMVEVINHAERIKDVALSGGVFQNRILLERVTQKLYEKGYQVFVNEKVPPNDGGISVGQYFVAQNRIMKGV